MEKQNKVILADDDADDRDLFLESLAQPHFEALAVSNGTELLNYLDAQIQAALPDCIFLDLNMPVLGGKECLQRIRSNEKFKDIPVVIYSTSSNKKDIEDSFALGANLYVVKASSYATMKNMLERIINLDWQTCKQQRSLSNFVYKSA